MIIFQDIYDLGFPAPLNFFCKEERINFVEVWQSEDFCYVLINVGQKIPYTYCLKTKTQEAEVLKEISKYCEK